MTNVNSEPTSPQPQTPTGAPPPSAAGKGSAMTLLSKVLVRVVACIVILGLGFGIMKGLASLKQPPKQVVISEPTYQVEVVRVHPEDVPVMIEGWGEASSRDEVQIMAEVRGNIVEIHPRLDMGEVIPAGELLFRIDQRDYIAFVDQAQAQVERMKTSLVLLGKQYTVDKDRLNTVARTRELAETEYTRIRTLLEKDEVGSQSIVDRAEMEFNRADDAFDQLRQLVDLYPDRIDEARSGLDATKAQLAQAKANLERTEVVAPFNARVKMVQLEVGQYAAPGVPIMVLADDSLLEISVPLDSRDARQWLRFNAAGVKDESWFGALEPVRCRICWTEDPDRNYWNGILNRVERFDQMTRTVTVAIQIQGEEAKSPVSGLPLVDGMFTQVKIPGEAMRQVYRVPRWAVSFEGQAYLAMAGAETLFLPASREDAGRGEARKKIDKLRGVRENGGVEAESTGFLAGLKRRLSGTAGGDGQDGGEAGGDAEALSPEELEKKLWRAFGALAAEYGAGGTDAAKAGQPGADAGAKAKWLLPEELAPELVVAYEKLAGMAGEASEVVETDDGFWLVKVATRLKRRDVTVARTQGEETFVQEGLAPGDLVVTTRLVNPLPNSLLECSLPEDAAGDAEPATAAETARAPAGAVEDAVAEAPS